MLNYLSKMSLITWLLVMVGLLTIFSVGKVLTLIGLGITLLLVVIKYWKKIVNLLGEY